VELQEAEQWLEGLINVERLPDFGKARLGLEAIEALLSRVGNPQHGLRVLHVAGSKGKGSTSLLAEAVLLQLGIRTATFTSPHLVRWTERFRIDGVEVPDAALASALTRLRPHVDVLRDGPDPPSFFDVTTAAAFLLFAEARVEVAIFEVGLGGRLDSTNVCEPAVTAITSIELEHTEKLGDTEAAIAAEKAGIAKRAVPLVIGAMSPEALGVVVARAKQVAAPVTQPGVDYRVECLSSDATGTRFCWSDGPVSAEFVLAAPGVHQAGNAALALSSLRRLEQVDEDALITAAARAFERVRLPGRIEVLRAEPWLVVDGAHTAASARELAAVLATIDAERRHLVLSVSLGKDLAAICEALAPHADKVTVTRADLIRAHSTDELAAAIRAAAPNVEVEVEPDPALAAECAVKELGRRDLLCAAGSIYLAGIARERWVTE
jgi:dihydrofolate synthase/folylpolyglutamate synthase